MFGLFSISKILVLGAVVLAVWYGFKWLGNRERMQKQAAKQRSRKGPDQSAASSSGPTIEDMVQCPDCGAYVPDDGRHICG
jgi:hypothetical protein